jgi:UDP-glucuronate decarboxylase
MTGYGAQHVVVAGGAGFLGRHLVAALLAAGARVTVIDSFVTGPRDGLIARAGLRVIEHDVIAPLPGGIGPVDVVFNLACPASPVLYQADPVFTWRTSVYGTDNLLGLARETGARFVQASTSEVYGDPEVSPQPESYAGRVNIAGPRACYDEGKRAAETLIHDMIRMHGIDARIARIFNTYGPGMRADDGRVISEFTAQAMAGQPLSVFGEGSQTRSFCHVSDMVRGLMALGARPGLSGLVVNLGSDDEISITELARLVTAIAGVPLVVAPADLPPDDPKCRRPDLTVARAVLGWAPRVSLEDGLRDLLGARMQA